MEIEPVGATDRSPEMVERRIWNPPSASPEEPEEAELLLRRATSQAGDLFQSEQLGADDV
jgi:hypothetical protein